MCGKRETENGIYQKSDFLSMDSPSSKVQHQDINRARILKQDSDLVI